MMVSFLDEPRGRYGVGPICAQLPIAPSTYYEHKGCEGEPERGPARVRRDEWLCGEIRRLYAEHFGVYEVRKVWRPLNREGVAVARCTPAPEPHRGVARLMRRMGLQRAVRGRLAFASVLRATAITCPPNRIKFSHLETERSASDPHPERCRDRPDRRP